MTSVSPSLADSWQEVIGQARLQKEADLYRDEKTPLEFGAPICWKKCGIMGTTDGFHEVHRVGFPQFGHAYTACGELIPGPIMWLPLSPALVRTMKNCTYCNAEIGRIAREKAA